MTTGNAEVTAWPHLYTPGRKGAPVLLMLHGTGSNEHDIASLAGALDPQAGVLAPRGRVQEHGMLRWFRRHAEGVFDVDDVIDRSWELAGFIDAARNHYSLGDRKVVAVGFSNGANIALATAMLHPEVLDRVIAFSGMYPLGERPGAAALPGSRILALNGDTDPMAPLASVTKLMAELNRQGATVEQVQRPGGHGIEPNDLDAARNWLARHG
ncbi:alpha/beta hydrolase [Arthrobacter globiformis]|uniref:alpha/beta hydrolase n=1 Tax=Arthrobacter globiformis TaxID=1665 RepID=UPI00278E98F2|nr:alpha/beta hydrolase [Arthrobacter globiformis]MDQ0618709.1 phospholipase/carboxylesterase [Arthrobacter globiformis]